MKLLTFRRFGDEAAGAREQELANLITWSRPEGTVQADIYRWGPLVIVGEAYRD
jgi:hypothetical protein